MSKPREFWLCSNKIIIDSCMIDIINQYTWSICKSKSTFYAYTNIRIGKKSTRLLMHRFLTGQRSGLVDHKNRNGLDNRLCNLRYATSKQNSYNRVRPNKLGFRGVYRSTNSPNFSFQIQKDGKKTQGHGFKTAEQAARAYDKLSKELHGEFGIRNFND